MFTPAQKETNLNVQSEGLPLDEASKLRVEPSLQRASETVGRIRLLHPGTGLDW